MDPVTESASIPWTQPSSTMNEISFVSNCMIDETALKPSVQYNIEDNCLYGFSAMPRFVVLRNVDENFNVNEFFNELSIQHDTKTNKPICGLVQVTNADADPYYLGYAQLATYRDWKLALSMENHHLVVEMIDSTPKINEENIKGDIDRIFAESSALNRPSSTYVYSMVISNCCKSLPVQEAAVISTNNRYLQHQDHQFLVHNLMKMLSFFKVRWIVLILLFLIIALIDFS